MFRTAERIFRSAEHTFHSGERTFRSAEHKTNTVQRYIKYDYHVSFSPVILILLLLFIRHRLIGLTIQGYPKSLSHRVYVLLARTRVRIL